VSATIDKLKVSAPSSCVIKLAALSLAADLSPHIFLKSTHPDRMVVERNKSQEFRMGGAFIRQW
jgi:hypothetical protein